MSNYCYIYIYIFYFSVFWAVTGCLLGFCLAVPALFLAVCCVFGCYWGRCIALLFVSSPWMSEQDTVSGSVPKTKAAPPASTREVEEVRAALGANRHNAVRAVALHLRAQGVSRREKKRVLAARAGEAESLTVSHTLQAKGKPSSAQLTVADIRRDTNIYKASIEQILQRKAAVWNSTGNKYSGNSKPSSSGSSSSSSGPVPLAKTAAPVIAYPPPPQNTAIARAKPSAKRPRPSAIAPPTTRETAEAEVSGDEEGSYEAPEPES